MTRTLVLVVSLMLALVSLRAQPGRSGAVAAEIAVEEGAISTPKAAKPKLVWHDVTTWGVEGRAWTDMERELWFDRLPLAAKGRVTTQVWNRSRDSAGMMVRFRTDAASVWAGYTLRKDQLAGVNMTAIGASGIDLYAKDNEGRWRWAGVARPNGVSVRQAMVTDVAPGMREYAAYLPLHNALDALAFGVPEGARFEPVAPRQEKPIVFYGTSITHGSSASRPGMVHTAILGRRLDLPVVNLGFAGNGRMDAAVGRLLVGIDAAVYVVDCLPNMSAEEVRQKCIPLVRQLRAARPDTPIVLVEDRRNANAWLVPRRDQYHEDNHAALRDCFAQLQQAGVTGIFYVGGDGLFGRDDEGTTDGSHPSDLGCLRQADVLEPVLRAALKR